MALSDRKRAMTLNNVLAREAQKLQAIAAKLNDIKARYDAATPPIVTTGTVLQGNLTAINAWLTSVNSAANAAIVATIISNVSPTHGGDAI